MQFSIFKSFALILVQILVVYLYKKFNKEDKRYSTVSEFVKNLSKDNYIKIFWNHIAVNKLDISNGLLDSGLDIGKVYTCAKIYAPVLECKFSSNLGVNFCDDLQLSSEYKAIREIENILSSGQGVNKTHPIYNDEDLMRKRRENAGRVFGALNSRIGFNDRVKECGKISQYMYQQFRSFKVEFWIPIFKTDEYRDSHIAQHVQDILVQFEEEGMDYAILKNFVDEYVIKEFKTVLIFRALNSTVMNIIVYFSFAINLVAPLLHKSTIGCYVIFLFQYFVAVELGFYTIVIALINLNSLVLEPRDWIRIH